MDNWILLILIYNAIRLVEQYHAYKIYHKVIPKNFTSNNRIGVNHIMLLCHFIKGVRETSTDK